MRKGRHEARVHCERPHLSARLSDVLAFEIDGEKSFAVAGLTDRFETGSGLAAFTSEHSKAANSLHLVERVGALRLVCQPLLNLGHEPRRDILSVKKMDLVARSREPDVK